MTQIIMQTVSCSETGKVVYNGANEIDVNAEIDDGSDIADLML